MPGGSSGQGVQDERLLALQAVTQQAGLDTDWQQQPELQAAHGHDKMSQFAITWMA